MAAGVTAEGAAFPAAEAFAHPAFEPLRPWLRTVADAGAWPGPEVLNALAAASERPPATASGRPVRFCAPPCADARHYEQRIFDSGEVATRPHNLHDLFNALAWLAFPRLKAALNARHVARLPQDGARRSPLRDLLTLVDEGGVIVAGAAGTLPELADLIRGFRWQELFWDRRSQVLRDLRFVLVGHSAYEKALSPYPGITCKALFIATPPERLAGGSADLVAWLDRQAAGWIEALPGDAAPRRMAPLPVFGYPGWLAGGDVPGFYTDRRWFRPGRRSASHAELEQAA